MSNFQYQDLAVYKLSVDFSRRVFDVCGQSRIQPQALRDRILELAFSVPTNLAIGTGRGTREGYAENVQYSIDALRECITLLQVFGDMGMVDNMQVRPLDEMVRRANYMLIRLKRSVLGLENKKRMPRQSNHPEIRVAEYGPQPMADNQEMSGMVIDNSPMPEMPEVDLPDYTQEAPAQEPEDKKQK